MFVIPAWTAILRSLGGQFTRSRERAFYYCRGGDRNSRTKYALCACRSRDSVVLWKKGVRPRLAGTAYDGLMVLRPSSTHICCSDRAEVVKSAGGSLRSIGYTSIMTTVQGE
jgi:hypothetical protein